jgi:hypothetical protein
MLHIYSFDFRDCIGSSLLVFLCLKFYVVQSEGSQSTPNKEAENGAKSWDTQRSDAKPEHVQVNESDSLVQKIKNKENKRKAEVEDEESSPFPVCSDTAKPNKLRRVRREKEPFGESGISSVSTVGQEKQLNTQASIEQLSQQYLEVTTNEPNALAELERHFTGEFSEETPSEQAIPSTIISDINQLEAIPLNNTSQPKNTQPETIPSNTLQSEINQPETIHSEAIPSTTIPTYTIVQPNSEPHPTTVGSKPKEASTPTQGKLPLTKRRKFTVHNLEEASEKKDSGSSVAKISSSSGKSPSSFVKTPASEHLGNLSIHTTEPDRNLTLGVVDSPNLTAHYKEDMSVVRVEFLHRIVRLVKDRKHEGRSTIHKILLKGKIVTSHIYIYTQTQHIIHEQNKLS